MKAQRKAMQPDGAEDIVEESSMMAAPFLAAVTEAAWMDFKARLEAYRALGGKRSLRTLFSSAALEIMEELGVFSEDDTSEAATIAAVSALFAPLTVVDAYDRFRAITMRTYDNDFSLEAVLAYNLAYAQLYKLCRKEARPSDSRLRELYLRNLRPQRLAHCVGLCDPESLADARKCAVQEVKKLQSMRTILGGAVSGSGLPGLGGVASRGPVGAYRPSSDSHRVGKPSNDGRVEHSNAMKNKSHSTLTCHSCGGRGHKSFECPSRAGSSATAAPRALTSPPPRADVPRGAPLSAHTTRASTGSLPGPPKRLYALAAAQGAGSETPHVPVNLIAHDGSAVPAIALFDTGSEVSLISRSICAQLKQAGVLVREMKQELRTAGGSVVLQESVECELEIEDSGRLVRARLRAAVHDVGEQVLLGFPFLRETGLLHLLQQSGSHGGRPACSATSVNPGSGLDQADLRDVGATVGLGEDANEDFAEVDADVVGTQEISDDANSELRANIEELLSEYRDLFEELPPYPADVPGMPIELLPGTAPKSHAPRRVSPAMQQIISEEVAELQRLGIVAPSSSQFASPVVLVRKKDGGRRMCVDYRAVNACTVPLRFPIPNARALLERVAGNAVFATLDLRSGFHQIPLDPAARPLTAFVTPDGLFEFTRVPFGLRNAPPFFQQTMTTVLSGIAGRGCEVFIDDIVVCGRDATEFLRNLRAVFDRLRAHGLRLKGAKCRFGMGKIEYLGHTVSGEGVELSASRRQAIAGIKPPRNVGQLRAFLGLANYFRGFVKGYAMLAKPLTSLCSARVKFVWGSNEQVAFEALKAEIIAAPLLHHLDYDKEVVLRTDASTVGVGGLLLQRAADGTEEPVCFVSKAFSPAETRWSTIEQEAFAIFFGITSLSHHLLGHRFLVETDHRNLVFMDKATAPKIVRWRLRLQEYDFEVRHIAGKDNPVADGLSRCLVLQHVDEIKQAHNAVVGHRGVRKTLDALHALGYDWPGMSGDVEEFVRSCPTCQKVRLGQGSFAAAIRTTAVTEPFEVVAIDAVGPLPEDSVGNKYILVAVDAFTRFAELVPAPDTSAQQAARALLHIFGRYGAPRFLRSDQGSQFTAGVIAEFCARVGTEQQLTVPYRPESNGIVERANSEVMKHLRGIVMDRRVAASWSEWLPLVQRVLNATPHLATGVPPARMLFGDAVHLDRGLLLPFRDAPDAGELAVENYVQRLTAAQRDILRASREHQDRVVGQRLAKSPQEPTTFQPGDYVLASYPGRPPNKLAPRWRGPLVVVEANGNTYRCQDLLSQKLVNFHATRLKRYDMAQTEEPAAVAAVDADEFVVEAIVAHRGPRRNCRRADLEFRVRWAGYQPDEDTWLPYREVADLAALDAYAAIHPELRL